MQNKRIVVVDDDTGIQELLKTELEKCGFDVEIISEGNVFIEVVSRNKPDLVLMDVSLPGMDGITLCHELKHTSGINDIPVIMLTAYPDKKTVSDAMTFGAEDFVSKPFSVAVLKEKIDKVINKQKS